VAEGPSGEHSIFVDTGYLLALERRTDENHRRALGHWRSLRGRGLPRLVTTTYVFDEVVTYLNSRGLHASAVKTGRRLLESPSVELVRVGDRLFRAAFDLLERRPD
jgi:predicted nucleic acid-binding protein